MTFLNRLLGWIYFSRVPLSILAVIALLGPVGRSNDLLGNVINMDGWEFRQFFFLAFTTVLACCGCVIALNLNNYYGTERFRFDPFPATVAVRSIIFALGVIPAAILLVSVGIASPGSQALPFAAGVAAACLLILAVKIFQTWWSDPSLTPTVEYFVVPFDAIPRVEAAFARLQCSAPPFGGKLNSLAHGLEAPLVWLFRRTPAGYLHSDRKSFRNGHLFAASYAVFALGFYLTAGGMGTDVRDPWPSLTYILMFLMVLCALLAGMTFLLDRFRIPLLIPAVLFFTIAGNFSRSDHVYRVEPSAALDLPTPADILGRKVSAGRSPILVVTAGGGIQASVWTAEVLDQLTNHVPGFRDSLTLIAGASGGSVGTMFYLHKPGNSFDLAKLPSLEYAAWGWLKPDVIRSIFPWGTDQAADRGLALEQSWAQRLDLKDETLGSWARQVRDDRMPALIFNSTALESGSAMLFSTSAPGNGSCKDGGRLHRFHGVYGNRLDVRVVTAARLGATFPYVTPAARPSGDTQPALHLVDGGYSDNYGVVSAVDWLEDGLSDQALERAPDRVLILRIRSFPDPSAQPKTPKRGWFFQSFAPLLGLAQVRESAQRRNADRFLASVKRFWALAPETPAELRKGCVLRTPLRISVVDIVYPDFGEAHECGKQPLSWRLNSTQQNCIVEAWKKVESKPCLQAIGDWLKGGRIPSACDVPNEETDTKPY